ncbi:DUF1878 family protein [Neobacillus mesonae]|uniref:DUF1878 family protein n=1 Tax=Neobacillus mesonae TaxID=1193713 RepID=UPI00203AC064|nr:DUF1878 family protein [Neobacillus mesonae]MCM3567898.1 YhaI family protein [Neobacillus mesonae]
MNEYKALLERIHLLEFHQKLLVKMIKNPDMDFYRIIVEHGISKQEMESFFNLCDELSLKLKKQKAEGFVHFHPLFVEFVAGLPLELDIKEIVKACLVQKLYVPLFQEFNKFIS